MRISSAFPSKYLRAADLPQGRDIRVAMDFVQLEQMEQTGDEKPALFFIDKQKSLILNKTNAGTIEAAYGEETENWHGKYIVLFATTTAFRGQQVACIRVKAPLAPSPDDLKTEAESLADDVPF